MIQMLVERKTSVSPGRCEASPAGRKGADPRSPAASEPNAHWPVAGRQRWWAWPEPDWRDWGENDRRQNQSPKHFKHFMFPLDGTWGIRHLYSVSSVKETDERRVHDPTSSSSEEGETEEREDRETCLCIIGKTFLHNFWRFQFDSWFDLNMKHVSDTTTKNMFVCFFCCIVENSDNVKSHKCSVAQSESSVSCRSRSQWMKTGMWKIRGLSRVQCPTQTELLHTHTDTQTRLSEDTHWHLPNPLP